jgi:hypothetical protein
VNENGEDDSVESERERVAFLEVSQVALHVSRLEKTYARWLANAKVDQHADRAIKDLGREASDKVIAFGVIASRLGQQYRSECRQ